jgi:hypothetical protein
VFGSHHAEIKGTAQKAADNETEGCGSTNSHRLHVPELDAITAMLDEVSDGTALANARGRTAQHEDGHEDDIV